MTESPTSPPRLRKLERALAEPRTQCQVNCGRIKIVEQMRLRDVPVMHAPTSSTPGGAPQEDTMRKARVLSTVAAALLLTAGIASAQTMNKDEAAPKSAPA